MPRIATADNLPDTLAALLPDGGRVLVQGAAGESPLLRDGVIAAGDALGAVTFTGALLPGCNEHSYLANPACRAEAFFMTPAMAAGGDAVRFLPLCYGDIFTHLSHAPIDAALAMLSPPDEDGLCSFGVGVDFLAALWPRIPVRIAHINPAMPRTRGTPGIPYESLSAVIEGDVALVGARDSGDDPVAQAIAGHIAGHVRNGATLQTGIGKVPGAVLRALRSHRNLRIHSGLILDEVVDLLDAGALASNAPVTAGVAVGSRALYDAVSGDAFRFHPVPVTHSATVIAAIPDFVSVNSALQVDLFGQVFSEMGPRGLMSGPGGASDYARAARLSPGGLRIIALPSTAGASRISRIVAPGEGAGPVSLGRSDVDLVVTEHGVADLRGMDYDARAARLMAIAEPVHRDSLAARWRDRLKP